MEVISTVLFNGEPFMVYSLASCMYVVKINMLTCRSALHSCIVRLATTGRW